MAQVDFSLRGVLRIRLHQASEQDTALVQRQLGLQPVPVEDQAEINITFTDPQPEPPGLRYIGLNDAAYLPDGAEPSFYILKGKHKARIKAAIPFQNLGQPLTITVERGLSSIPLLVQVINLALLAKGILPIHASAFTYRGKGALVTGWAKGGKTETLLAFTSRGASYVGDEWIYLGTGEPAGELEIPVTGPGQPSPATVEAPPAGSPGTMFGIPEPIRVWNWHLDSLPHYRARLKRQDQLRLGSLAALNRSIEWLAGPARSRGPAAQAARRLHPLVNRQLYAHFAPQAVFGRLHCQESAAFDLVIFAASHHSDEIRVEPLESQEVARRMLFSIMEEQSELLSYYRKFRFAFPDHCNPWLDNLERLQYKLLARALKDRPSFAIYHPYPVHIPRLYEALEPFFP